MLNILHNAKSLVDTPFVSNLLLTVNHALSNALKSGRNKISMNIAETFTKIKELIHVFI